MIRYMLDTNSCIAIMKKRPTSMQARLIQLSVGEVGISAIVAAELWYGVSCSEKKRQNEAALREFLDYVTVQDWPQAASPAYGQLHSALRAIGGMDLLIAAHALFLGVVLVTDNTREFKKVPGLKIENWLD